MHSTCHNYDALDSLLNQLKPGSEPPAKEQNTLNLILWHANFWHNEKQEALAVEVPAEKEDEKKVKVQEELRDTIKGYNYS